MPFAQKIIQHKVVPPFLGYKLYIRVPMSRVIPPMLLRDPSNRDLTITIRNLLHLFQPTFHMHNNTTPQIGQIGPSKLQQINLGNKDGEGNLMETLPPLYLCHNIHTINLLLISNNSFLVMCHLLYLQYLNMPNSSRI